jgi:phospholipid transport system substrate-binding protein
MSVRLIKSLTLLLILTCLVPVPAATSTPTEEVKKTIDKILLILKNQALNWGGRQAKIRAIVDERFDFRSMSQSVLATHWKKATPVERDRFVEFFSQYLEHTYMAQIEKYSDHYVKYTNEKISGNRAIVDTFIVADTVEIPVNYRLRLNDGEWFAYDVVIEGVSLVNNYRNIYSAIVKTEGISGLLDRLEEKNEELKRLEKARRIK